jgi:hypothetical protein
LSTWLNNQGVTLRRFWRNYRAALSVFYLVTVNMRGASGNEQKVKRES